MSERHIHGRTFEVSHRDKVLYPEDGISKGDVIDYYERIAGTMLPYVEGRFISMQRFPDGIAEEGFYEKEAPEYFPDWIDTGEVAKESGSNRQVIIDEPATLVYLAQQACITPHIWLSRAASVRNPDRMVFDFDPSRPWREAFSDVRRAARALRDLLDEIGLVGYVMTSGSRGLHVHVPIRPEDDFDAVKDLARAIADRLAARHPEHLTTAMRKNKRGERIFVDYLRNEYAQTTAAPYALRARPGAPVATPLDWDELGASGMGPRRYTLRNLFRRLAQKDDPWHGMGRRARGLEGPRQALADL
ncbi:MAG: non-homologous end-joining DNA ligase [Acidobacteriota bacterium]|jgi:bifunctional non-homologous end joining protein LigD